MNPAELTGGVRLRIGGKVVLPGIRTADTFALRSLGLMGRSEVPAAWGDGLFFPNCRSLHGCFMRFDLEVWFLDAAGQPAGAPKLLKPWRVVTGPGTSCHCMEIKTGRLDPDIQGEWCWEPAL